MHLVDALVFHVGTAPKRLELLVGDLAAMHEHDADDVLVVSAFPNDYVPTETSLIGALQRRGLSVGELAKSPEFDLRAYWACWLSRPVPEACGFRRVLCYEPESPEVVAERVRGIFQSLAPLIAGPQPVRTVVLPVVGAGDQGADPREVVCALLAAAYGTLRTTALDRVRLVLPPSVADGMYASVSRAFADFKAEHMGTVTEGGLLSPEHDVFISYSQRRAEDADCVQSALSDVQPGVRIFRDTRGLRGGLEYREQLDFAMRRSRRVVALYSPEYFASRACKDEFNAAWNLRRGGARDLLYPMFIRSQGLDGQYVGPSLDSDPRKTEVHWMDCREADRARIAEACTRLVEDLQRSAMI